MFHLTTRISRRFAVSAQLANKREAVRFTSQNISWNVGQLQYHTDALARGLYGLGLRAGDRLLLRLPQDQQAEAVTVRLAAKKIGAQVIRRKALSSESDVMSTLQKDKPTGIIFDPQLKLGEHTFGEHLRTLFPTTLRQRQGQAYRDQKLPFLKFLISTGHTAIPGVYKFRNILNYSSDEAAKFQPKNIEAGQIPKSDKPLIVTDAGCGKVCNLALTNALLNGRFVVCAETKDLPYLFEEIPEGQIYSVNNIDNLPESYTLLTPRGSQANKNHKNRTELQID